MYDDLYGVQRYKMKYECGSLKRNSSVPPSLFIFLFFCGLNGSFYLTLTFPLWDHLILSSLGSFPHFRGNTLYITRSIGDLSHFTKVLTYTKCNYHDANVCLCQCSRICNDTSASCSNE